PPEVPDALIGDALRLRQILVNLVGNAIKFTDRGEVVVDVSVDSESVADDTVAGPPPFQHLLSTDVLLRFAVRDTGIGIPADKQRLIFDAFSQADTSTTRKYGGTGLGLSISSQLAQMMGGRIWVESEVGRGSTFQFTARFCRMQQATVAETPEPADVRDLRVLVVDDNATNRRILEEMLANWRMRPSVVDGGPAALTALEQARMDGEPFGLVLLDAMMPDMDGFELAAEIRRRSELAASGRERDLPPAPPALMMLSSADHQGDVARCRALGVAVFLRKPIKQSE